MQIVIDASHGTLRVSRHTWLEMLAGARFFSYHLHSVGEAQPHLLAAGDGLLNFRHHVD
jgi:hypothetical protein